MDEESGSGLFAGLNVNGEERYLSTSGFNSVGTDAGCSGSFDIEKEMKDCRLKRGHDHKKGLSES